MTRSRCILSSERVFGNGFIRVNSKEKIPSTSIWVRSVSSSYREATSRKIPSTENGPIHCTPKSSSNDVCLCVCVCVCFYTLGQSWSLLSPLSYVRHTSSYLSLPPLSLYKVKKNPKTTQVLYDLFGITVHQIK